MSIALLAPDPRCPLCGSRYSQGEALLFMTHMGLRDPLDGEICRMDDNVVHQGCFDGWARRDEFVAAYNGAAETLGCSGLALVQTHDGRWVEAWDLEPWIPRSWILLAAVLMLRWWTL